MYEEATAFVRQPLYLVRITKFPYNLNENKRMLNEKIRKNIQKSF